MRAACKRPDVLDVACIEHCGRLDLLTLGHKCLLATQESAHMRSLMLFDALYATRMQVSARVTNHSCSSALVAAELH